MTLMSEADRIFQEHLRAEPAKVRWTIEVEHLKPGWKVAVKDGERRVMDTSSDDLRVALDRCGEFVGSAANAANARRIASQWGEAMQEKVVSDIARTEQAEPPKVRADPESGTATLGYSPGPGTDAEVRMVKEAGRRFREKAHRRVYCQDCRFFAGAGAGFCHRRAPSPHWPLVSEDTGSWCGEGELR